MLLSIAFVLIGLVVLVYSADKFVEGAAATATHLGMPSLLIGVVVIGFGTSAPEMVVSVLSASQGNPAIALGNAYGSNIANIGLILGVAAVINPITVQSRVLRKELPILILVTAFAAYQLLDGQISRTDAVFLLSVFAILMIWSIWQDTQDAKKTKAPTNALPEDASEPVMPIRSAVFWLLAGMGLLVGSSHLLVTNAVEIARYFGVGDMFIGLTIVAIGTSLPELASGIIASRKGECDLVLGNVLGSNLFNTLAVVGLAGVIHPIKVPEDVLGRDVVAMGVLLLILTIAVYVIKKKSGRIGRAEGFALLACYLGYNAYLISSVL